MALRHSYQNVFSPSMNLMENDYFFDTFFWEKRIARKLQGADILHSHGNFALLSFNGKEKDYESGFHYYGARYYRSEVLTGWLSVDPMMDKYPNISPYNYCIWNPIKVVDPNGMDTVISFNERKPNENAYKKQYGGNYKKIYEKEYLSYKRNKFLAQNARQYKNTSDIIHVFAHGANNFWGFYTGKMLWSDGTHVGPIELYYKLYGTKGSKVFRDNDLNGKGSVIFLHSCNAGQGFAQELSEIVRNCLIIAPSDLRSVITLTNQEFVWNGGDWRFFLDGKLIYSHLGDIWSTMVMEYNLELLGTIGVLKLANDNKLEELFK